MKKGISLILILLLSSVTFAGNLSALFSYCAFNVPGTSPYLEVYLHVIGTTVNFVDAEGGKKRGQIEVQWTIKDGEKTIHFDKYNLNSPLIGNKDSLIPDFIDQQRIKLSDGNYQLELAIRDKNSDAAPVKVNQNISIHFPADSASVSDIELLESFSKTTTAGPLSKGGYDLVPSVDAFLPKQITGLKFYAEVYNTDKNPADEYLVRYYLSMFDNNKVLPNYSFNLKQKPAHTNVVLVDIPISDLQSGNYNLNIEVRSKQNELITSRKVMFQRSNPQTKNQLSSDFSNVDIQNSFVTQFTSTDTLNVLLDCLYPISTNVESEVAQIQIRQGDVTAMQKFLFYFWQKRNQADPEQAFRTYMKEVEKVDASFAAMKKKGYETDRGRVYLQYGPPNIVSDSKSDPAALPYEIWQYYKLPDGQTNRKFVFCERELSTHDFELIHSDAIAELHDLHWESIVHDGPGYVTDPSSAPTMFDSREKQRYSNPH